MRDFLMPTVVAIASSLFTLALAARTPGFIVTGMLLVALVVPVVYCSRRRRARDQNAFESMLGHLAEFRLPLPDGVKEQLPAALLPLVIGHETVFREMNRRYAALTERVERYSFMEMHSEDTVMQVDADGVVKYVSPAIRIHLGYTPQELVGTRILDRLDKSQVERWVRSLKAAARENRAALIEGNWQRKDGRYVALEISLRHARGLNGSVAGTISMARNVEARNALRDQLTRAAHTDHLTGLPNRAALAPALERSRERCKEKPFALLLFDLDRFKQVNDSLGHNAGDAYLIETANRVRSMLRPADCLARMGGDEFVALIDGVDSEEEAHSIATRMIDVVSQPYTCHGALLHPKTSIGIVLSDDSDLSSNELMSRADRALYAAKHQGGNLAIVHNALLSASTRKDFAIEQELAQALEQDRLLVHFQPIVEARSWRPVLAEALVRVRNKDGSLLEPSHFIDVAERTGQIFQIGQWVLEQACWQARRLEEDGRPMSISVNVSPRQLLHINFVRSVEAVLELTEVAPSSILLEVTESAVMEDMGKVEDILNHLRCLGFRLALDDFGTGYSSISMLKTLPFDVLKIDRSFVQDAQASEAGASMLGAIIAIGKSLKLTIVAEGVETVEQALCLEDLGCDLLQGFHFFRPMDAAADAQVVSVARRPSLVGCRSVLKA